MGIFVLTLPRTFLDEAFRCGYPNKVQLKCLINKAMAYKLGLADGSFDILLKQISSS